MKAIGKVALLGLVLAGLAVPPVGRAESADEIKNCYMVYGEARYGAFAYKHVVIVKNRCDITLQCEVWTDVDPEPKQPLTVGPKATGEVIVRNNSPARGFKAFGECKK